MRKALEKFKKIVSSYRKLVEKKPYIEFLTAILSIPVLISIILVNVNNLKSPKDAEPTPTPEVKEERIYIPITSTQQDETEDKSSNPSPSTDQSSSSNCKPEIGPVSISSPDEGETVTTNPITITISYKTGQYCAIISSYSINGGAWSNYDDTTSIALYNLSEGKIKVDVKVKSVITGEVQKLTRNFVYKPDKTTIPTDSPSEVQGSSTSAK